MAHRISSIYVGLREVIRLRKYIIASKSNVTDYRNKEVECTFTRLKNRAECNDRVAYESKLR